ADVLDGVRAEEAGVVHAPAHGRDGGPALYLVDGRFVDVGDEQPGGVGADVDYGDPHRNVHSLRSLGSPDTARHASDERVLARCPFLGGPAATKPDDSRAGFLARAPLAMS